MTSTESHENSSSLWDVETIEDIDITAQVESSTNGYEPEELDIDQGIIFQIPSWHIYIQNYILPKKGIHTATL